MARRKCSEKAEKKAEQASSAQYIEIFLAEIFNFIFLFSE